MISFCKDQQFRFLLQFGVFELRQASDVDASDGSQPRVASFWAGDGHDGDNTGVVRTNAVDLPCPHVISHKRFPNVVLAGGKEKFSLSTCFRSLTL